MEEKTGTKSQNLRLQAWVFAPSELLAAPSAGRDSEWRRFNLDTGAAITAFPQDQQGIRKVSGPSGKCYKTASGEKVEDQGEGVVSGTGEDSMLRTLRGRIAPVHKPLISAAAVRKKQNHIWIGPDGSGAIVPVGSAAARHLESAEKAMWKTPGKCTWLYEEAGVYNLAV